jgi:small-conductance mechanosensitive channel
LNQLRIASVVLYLVVGAILMLIILTFVVGLKDVIPNIVAWVFIQRKGTIKEGRRVEVREIAGVVENVGYLETEIKTDRGDILYVPNALFMKSKFSLKKEK